MCLRLIPAAHAPRLTHPLYIKKHAKRRGAPVRPGLIPSFLIRFRILCFGNVIVLYWKCYFRSFEKVLFFVVLYDGWIID